VLKTSHGKESEENLAGHVMQITKTKPFCVREQATESYFLPSSFLINETRVENKYVTRRCKGISKEVGNFGVKHGRTRARHIGEKYRKFLFVGLIVLDMFTSEGGKNVTKLVLLYICLNFLVSAE
jgi:hypothetical protein